MTDTLEFGISHRTGSARQCLIKSIKDCIQAIGLDVAIAASGARRQDLGDALADRPGRRLEVEWVWSIALVSPEPLRAQVAACLVEALGYGVAPIRPLTTDQKLARLEYRVATRSGSAGQELVEENQR